MKKVLSLSNRRNTGLSALAGIALCLQVHPLAAQSLIDGQATKTVVEQGQNQPSSPEKRSRVTYDTYILGPGDRLDIDLLDLPELSGSFSIGPDGTLYLPRLRALFVEGLTVEELRILLTKQFSTYVRDPQLYVRPCYRPIRIYVGGEVIRRASTLLQVFNPQLQTTKSPTLRSTSISELGMERNGHSHQWKLKRDAFPTVFDAIRSAQGLLLARTCPKCRSSANELKVLEVDA